MDNKYKVIYSNRKTMALQIVNGELLVRAPNNLSDAVIKAYIKENRSWIDKHLQMDRERQMASEGMPKLTIEDMNELGDKALNYIPQRVKHFAPLVGVTYGRITIRNQKTRWGSCSSKGNLNFNCLLMLAPPEVIDSVVVHELCHRLEMNHSSRFYEHVLRVMPSYYEAHAWLKANGPAIMKRCW